ncbi:MAG: GNAT family N-acetyltransferase [Candidatus Xenobia bacterium]
MQTLQAVQLMRPGAGHVELLARLYFRLMPHRSFETESEMVQYLRTVNDDILKLSLFILREGKIIGLVEVGPYSQRPSILAFGLVPPYDAPEQATTILAQVLRELKGAFSDLHHALYPDPSRAVFEGVGFVTVCSTKKIVAPIVARPVPKAPGRLRRATLEDVPALGRLMDAAYGFASGEGQALAEELFGTTYSLPASYVGEREGGLGLAAASLILGRRGQKIPTLSHAITHPEEQKKGWGTSLVQSSMNVLAGFGCEQMDGWALTDNHGVTPLHRRFGFERVGPLQHQGLIR